MTAKNIAALRARVADAERSLTMARQFAIHQPNISLLIMWLEYYRDDVSALLREVPEET
jgi:hypothetical protein